MSNSAFDVTVHNLDADYTNRYYTPWFPISFDNKHYTVNYERYVEGLGFEYKIDSIPRDTIAVEIKEKGYSYKYYENDIIGRYGYVEFEGCDYCDKYHNPISKEEGELRYKFIGEIKNSMFDTINIILKYKKLFEDLKNKERNY